MNKKNIILVLVILVIIVGAYLFWSNKTQAPVVIQNSEKVNQQIESPPAENVLGNQTVHEVIYTDEGYSPKEITINLGDTVLWKNQSSRGSWVGSAMHPTHVIYSGTSLQEHCPDLENVTFDECKSSQPGESWSFTFNKKGTWRYHNHVKSSHSGTVIVQ